MLEIYGFTPLHAAIGGALLGTATLMRMWLTGRILGVSGIAGGLVRGKASDASRWLFTAGLVAGGLGLQVVYPQAFAPVALAPWREALAGLAVGLGAGLGNGCTSGHGISGNARLSKRSIAYTLTFMGAGFAVASLLSSASNVQVQHAPLPPVDVVLRTAVRLFAAHACAYAAVAALVALDTLPQSVALNLTSLVDGTLFAFGLGLSGMTSPARVAQFLDVSAGTWNPTLMFVMAGGLGLMAPFMTLLVLPKRLGKPVLGKSFELPTNSTIDAKLLAGGVLFGSGWAIGGMCPGPALVNLASPHGAPLIFVGTMFAGLALSDSKQVCGCLGG
ncbi:hypothetical protein KFE25_005630 [Diacronema lutheri]|uniref:YeeE/YedE family protein n=2 Tax=Diacronema lutheri TaxID=2081491 RepID=A0A8J5XV95_DIALT|nr:hypothetical protein KFE25_005630 [Diacronema lutheri]